MRQFHLILAATAFLLTLASPALARPVTIKFSHVADLDTPKGKATEYFKKLIEQRSGNRIRVEIFPNASLYDDRGALEALQENEIQMAAPAFARVVELVPELQVFDLPFIFKDISHLHRVLDGDIGHKLLGLASTKGMVALSFWDNGFKQLSSSRSLVAPGDIEGLKFRIIGSKVAEAQFLALGANPQRLSFSALYQELEKGSLDGQENTLATTYGSNLHRVQAHMYLSDHAFTGYLLVTNQKFWDQLPDDLKVITRGAILDATEYAREMSAKVNRDALEKIRQSGHTEIYQPSAEERAAWQRKSRKVYQQFSGPIGEELIEKILQD